MMLRHRELSSAFACWTHFCELSRESRERLHKAFLFLRNKAEVDHAKISLCRHMVDADKSVELVEGVL